MGNCEAKCDIRMENSEIRLVQGRKIWSAASKFEEFLQTEIW